MSLSSWYICNGVRPAHDIIKLDVPRFDPRMTGLILERIHIFVTARCASVRVTDRI